MKTKNFFERYKIFIICTRLARRRGRECGNGNGCGLGDAGTRMGSSTASGSVTRGQERVHMRATKPAQSHPLTFVLMRAISPILLPK